MLSALALVVLGAIAAAFYLLGRPGGPDAGGEIAAAQLFVRGQVPSRIDTHFSEAAETSVEALTGDRYRVSGWVDLVSKDGPGVRDTYTCSLHRDADRGWVADEVTLLQK